MSSDSRPVPHPRRLARLVALDDFLIRASKELGGG